MSVAASTWVWNHSTASGNPLLVLLSIAEAANSEGRESCQSVATLARHARCSESAVHRALRWLKDAGEIEATGSNSRYKNTTIYCLPKMAEQGDTPVASDTPVKMTPLSPATTEPLSPATPEPRTKPTTTHDSHNEGAVTEGRLVRPALANHGLEPLHPGWYPDKRVVAYLRWKARDTKVKIEDSFDRFVAHQRTTEAKSRNWNEAFMKWVSQDITRWRSEQEDEGPVDDLGIRRGVDPEQRRQNLEAIRHRQEQLAGLVTKRESE